MELMAASALSLLGTGYYLNKEQTSESKIPKQPAPTIKQRPKIVQNGGALRLTEPTGSGAFGAPLRPNARDASANFDQEIIGVFTPQYFDTKNTFSDRKQNNPAYRPEMVFRNMSPEVQAQIKNRLNLDQLRQKRHQFPEVRDSVTGILQSHGNNNSGEGKSGASSAGVTGFRGTGSGSSQDSGQQQEIPFNTNIDRECDLTHNNMVPFFGSTVTQSTDVDNRLATHKLELYTGQYNLRQQNKKEVKTLFPPIAGLSNVYGSPDKRDLSRYFPNNTGKRSNELPFEQIIVGAGLNQGFTARPSGGVHDQIRILPKRNEELYVNPKTEGRGKIIYGKALVDERTSIGNTYKYRPELLVDNRCGQRNFTTVGEVTAPTVRSGVILKSTDRSRLTRQLINHAKSAESNRSTPECLLPRSKLSNRQNFKAVPYRNTYQANGKRMNDFGKKGYQNKPNERSVTGPSSFAQAFRALTRSAKNAIVGWSDAPKYTRKQEYIVNQRPYGNLGTSQTERGPVYDPNYTARTTIRETTEDNQNMGTLTGASKSVVYDPNQTARTTIRETTEDNQNMGAIGRQTQQNGGAYQTGNWRPRNTQKQFTSDYEYTGTAMAAENKAARSYDDAYNAELNVSKEIVALGRKPAGSSVKLNKGKGYYNIDIKRVDGETMDDRAPAKDSLTGNRFNPNAVSECTLTSTKNTTQEDYHRLDPTLLEPFRRNGLTQSLHSY